MEVGLRATSDVKLTIEEINMTNLSVIIVFLVPTTLNEVPFTLLTCGDIIPGQAEVAGGHRLLTADPHCSVFFL